MEFSLFGQKVAAQSGINQLMDDLGRALEAGATGQQIYMLGGGNPAHIPAVQARFRACLQAILDEPGAFERFVGDYDTPQGNAPFIEALAALLRREFGWPIGPENIALTNGSQSAFFLLFNLFAGEFADGRARKILLPLAPEYIGYADVGLTHDFFRAVRPRIDLLDDGLFKYHIDFDALEVGDDTGAICVSRPTNPSGNVLTDDEVARLSALAREHDVPLILDNAYGTPFPHIIFTEARPVWDDHIVLCLSLSKLGLPATRTGIVVASAEVIQAVSAMNAVLNLAPGKIGASIATELMRTGEILTLSRETIMPFYRAKAERAVAQLRAELGDCDVRIHRPEGALFLWLWCRDLPITCQELYERLKARGVIVVPGHYFFPGLPEDDGWKHRHECLRVSYAQSDAVVEAGLRLLADEIRAAYGAVAAR